MSNYDLDVKISGKDQQEYMADLLEKNERQEIEIERAKIAVAVLKQMNNRSRIKLEAAKFAASQQEEN